MDVVIFTISSFPFQFICLNFIGKVWRRKFKGNSTIKLQFNANNSWKSCITSIFRGENMILAHSKFSTVFTKFS